MGQTCVISLGLDAVAVQVLGDLLGGFLQSDIDDTRLVGPLTHPLHQAPALVHAADRLYPQVEVGPVEARGDHIRGGDGELGLHIRNHLGRRGGRQQQRLGNLELALVVGELQVVRAEVVAPLGNTVRLVYHE